MHAGMHTHMHARTHTCTHVHVAYTQACTSVHICADTCTHAGAEPKPKKEEVEVLIKKEELPQVLTELGLFEEVSHR